MQAMDLGDSGLRYRIRRALRQIEEQHRQLHELRDRLAAAVAARDRADLRDGFVRYRHALGAHFELEDEVFFPALHGLDPGEGADLEELSREHGGLLGGLGRLATLLEDPGFEPFAAALAAFGRELARHERREECLVSRLAGAGA
jgi:hypothetical protein